MLNDAILRLAYYIKRSLDFCPPITKSKQCVTRITLIVWEHGPYHHDYVIKWKHFPSYWHLVWGIHRSPVNSPHKGQWRGALMFYLSYTWINGCVNNREAGDLRRHRAHYDVFVMLRFQSVNQWATDHCVLCHPGIIFIPFPFWHMLFSTRKTWPMFKFHVPHLGDCILLCSRQCIADRWTTKIP